MIILHNLEFYFWQICGNLRKWPCQHIGMGKNQSKLSKEDMEVLHRETGMDKTDIEVREITRIAISKICEDIDSQRKYIVLVLTHPF